MEGAEGAVRNTQVVDARARNISHNVRCTECGSQSIEDSQADIAILLRKLIRDEIRAGKSDKDIYKKLEDDFGETVLYAPKFDLQTAALWLSPLLVAGAAGGMWAYNKHRQNTNVHIMALNLVRGVPLTPKEKQTMLDVLTPPRRERNPLSSWWRKWLDDEGIEEADDVVPDDVEQVALARIILEQKEREQKMILDDIRLLSSSSDMSGDKSLEKEGDLWMITGGRSILVYMLKKELGSAKNLRKTATASLRMALHNAARQILMEKEKNKSPSCAMRISVQVNKVIWSMLADGNCFVEAEINDMKYEFDRDFKDFAVARFTIKYFVVRNCLPNAKFDMLISPWNPPPEWGKKVMLQVDTRHGAPEVGNTPFENFQVDIYPLKIHLTEILYHMIWGYLFPEEQEDYQRKQEVWKVSTTSGPKSLKKPSSLAEASASRSPSRKEPEVSSKPNPFLVPFTSGIRKSSLHTDSSQMWPSLINKAKKGGLDVIHTYVFWNLHEPQRGQYDFSGGRDIRTVIIDLEEKKHFQLRRREFTLILK